MQEALLQHIKRIWPDYELGDRIGSGSCAEVYRAVRKGREGEASADDYAALKIIEIPKNESEIDELRSAYGNDVDVRAYYEAVAKKYLREVRAMQSLGGGSNIARILEYRCLKKSQSVGWAICILMELLTPLPKYTQDSPLEESEVIKLGADICTALEECEKRGVVHRGIKPDNIFADVNGDFKLGDLGVAETLSSLTSGMMRRGSPNYLAPETEKNGECSAASNIYSLGVVLYQLMNNDRLPFFPAGQLTDPEESRIALGRRFSGEKLPPAANASPALNAVLLKACAFDKRSRFKSASELKQALEAAGNGTLDLAALALSNGAGAERSQDTGFIPAEPRAGGKEPPPDFDEEEEQEEDGGKGKVGKVLKAVFLALLGLLVLGGLALGAVLLIKSLGNKGGDGGSTSADGTPFDLVTIPPNGYVSETPDPALTTPEPTEIPTDIGPKPDIDPMSYYSYSFDLGKKFAIAGLEDGSAVVAGSNQRVANDAAGWDGVVQVAAGWYFAIGRTSDGRVLLAGTDSTSNNRVSAEEIASWSDIEFISANGCACAAIDSSGRLHITGGPGDKDASGLYSIPPEIYENGRPVSVSVGVTHVLVLFNTGKVAAISNQSGDWCEVGDWKDIVQVSAGERGSTALDVSGNVLYVGILTNGQMDFYGHTDIASISVKGWHLAYVTKSGRVEACGYDNWGQIGIDKANKQGVNVTAIATSAWNTAVLLSDGEIILSGYDRYIPFGEVESWENIAR